MRSSKHLRRWISTCWAAPALLGIVGCAVSRNQVNPPLASRPAGSNFASRDAFDSKRTPARSASTTASSRSPISSVPLNDFGATTSPRLERDVARYLDRPNQLFNPSTPIRQWRYIIVHHSAEPRGGLASIDRFHREKNHWDECGYHFVIGNGTESGDGEIEVGSRWAKQKHGAHTKPEGNQEYNENGIGICLVGNFNNESPTPKQVEACRRLITYLQQRCNVPSVGITTHGDVAGTHTDCPGRHFPYDQLIPSSGFAAR